MRRTDPIWVDPTQSSYPRLEGDASAEVVIVGAGISGMGAARRLWERGVRNIAVIESRTVASGASGRNAGFVMAVSPENFPRSAEPAEVGRARRIWGFTAENQRLIEEAIESLGPECEYRRRGSLCLAASEAEWVWVRESSGHAQNAGVTVELIPREQLPSSWLRSEYVGGAWYAGNGEIHPAKFVRGVASWLSRQGVSIFEGSHVEAVDVDDSTLRLRCGQATIVAGSVIIATNAYTRQLLGDVFAIEPVRGQVLATAPLDHTIAECPVYANHGYQYWRQTKSGSLVLGGWRDLDFGTEIGTEEHLNPLIQNALTQAAEGLCGKGLIVENQWSGIMGFTPDQQPLVGLVPGKMNVSIAAGYSGHGLAMAWHAAREAADILLGDHPRFADLFDPARFPTGAVTST